MQPLRVAAAPFGQAVANQNADVIKTASAARIPIRAAGTGSDHKRPVVAGSSSWSPRSKAVIESKSRVRANLMSRSSAARTSAVNGAFSGGEWLVSRLWTERGTPCVSNFEGVRWLATASAVAQSSTAP
jgi:hypothetical protein